MKQRGMKYDGSIDEYPITEGQVYELQNGSKIQIADITKGIPDFERQADCVFIDPAGSKGVLKSYYTKADKECPVDTFDEFIGWIKKCIGEINPDRLFVECFMRNRDQLESMVRELFPHVVVYDSMYYHKPENKSWIIQGTKKPEKYDFDGMDEWDIVYKICKEVPFTSITDFFMGQGLVAEAAFSAGKPFYGSDMNRNRLAVAISRVAKKGGVWAVK